MRQISDRELHEECGVFGVFGVPDAASLSYYGLHALQHRGQEGAGIVAVDEGGTFRRIKGSGLVTEVFDEAKLATLKGNTAIGHVRYTTAGGGGIENVQPFLFRHNTGDFALAHNGNIVNSALLREYLENKGSLFQSTSDSEILAHLIKKETRYHDRPRIFSIIDALNMLEGAFAFLIMTANRIYACRDKYGLRPLAIGRLGDGYVVSSETCAFDVLGAEFVRDVEPGEIVTIDRQGIRSRDYSMYKRCEMCSMEYIYFAVRTATSTAATSTPTARSRGVCSSRSRRPMRISWSVFPIRASARRWATPKRAACRTKWDSSRTSISAVRLSSLRRSCARRVCG